MTSPMTHQGTPTKLRSGNWGVRIEYMGVQPGDIVEVTTRRGDTWECCIECISYKGNGITICSTGKRIDHRPTTPTVQSTTTTTDDTGGTLEGRPFKLRCGSWGVRVEGTPTPGQTVVVRTRSGKFWETTIRGVVYTKNGFSVCLTETRSGNNRRQSEGYDDEGGRVWREHYSRHRHGDWVSYGESNGTGSGQW